MRILPGNAQHIGARHSQQDSFGFADPNDQAFLAHGGFLAVICDGMGGMEHGDAASRAAVRAFLDGYSRKTPEESIPAALERAVREANREVLSLATQLGLVENMGTTLVAAAVTEGAMYYVSVGDSALFLVSGGRHRMINHPHVFANVLDRAVARGVMSREDAENHPERESLTSYIGTEKLEEIDRNLEAYPLLEGDAVLLASDGMFKTLDDQDIEACLRGAPQSWPEELVALTLAKQREYQDNITVLSVAVESAEANGATPPGAQRPLPQRVERPLALDEKRTVLIPHSAPGAYEPPQVPIPPPPPAPGWTPVAQIPPLPVRHAAPRPAGRQLLLALILLLAAIAVAAAGFRWGLHRGAAAAPGAKATQTSPSEPPRENAPSPAPSANPAKKSGAKSNSEHERPHAEHTAPPEQ